MATSLIPDGVIDTFPFVGSKVGTIHTSVRSTNSDTNPTSPTWTAFTPTFSTITNSTTMTDEAVGNVVIMSATTANKPAVQSTPKQVVKVLPKVFASNSHSVYKGAMVTNAVTGKVAVGNGSNGLESKVMEELDNNTIVYNGTSYLFTQGKIYTYVGISNVVQNGVSYLYMGNTVTTTMNNAFDWGKNSATAVPIGSLNFMPTHQPVALDNSNSPACKWFTALSLDGNEYCLDIYVKGLVYNSGTTSYDGDNEVFDQLTNGVKTDINGNVVNTKVLTRRLGVFKK